MVYEAFKGYVMTKLDSYVKSEKHLPVFMRDFHDQKGLFKSVSEWASKSKSNKIGWVDAHCYVIDIFLQFMAMHGYTLQRTRANQEFYNIQDTLNVYEKKRRDISTSFLKEILNKEKS
jgi:hypothetical protein